MNWIVHKVVKLTEHNVNNADEVCEHLKVGDSAHMVGKRIVLAQLLVSTIAPIV